MVGKPLAGLQGNILEQPNMDQLQAAIREQREGKAILRYCRKDGEIYWSETFVAPVRGQAGDDGAVPISHFVLAQYDISAVMRFEAELAFQARHDILTGLANRRLLRERLEHEMAVAQRSGLPLWVVFIDLDRFKFVNDTLGHDAGDTLLKGVAERLLAATREVDTVARLGGDEFVLLLPQHGNGAPRHGHPAAHARRRGAADAAGRIRVLPQLQPGRGGLSRRWHQRRNADQARRYRHVPRQGTGPRQLAVLCART